MGHGDMEWKVTVWEYDVLEDEMEWLACAGRAAGM